MLTFFSVCSIEAQQRDFAVKVSLLPLMDAFGFPTANIGLENRVTDKISWYNELGIKIANSFMEVQDANFPKSFGFKYMTEMRYYLTKQSPLKGAYLGVNGYFSKLNYTGKIDYIHNYRDTLNHNLTIEHFSVKRTVFTSNVLIGKQTRIGKHFLIDRFIGLGVRGAERKSSPKKYNSQVDKLTEDIDITSHNVRNILETTSGQKIYGNFVMGIRLGYSPK